MKKDPHHTTTKSENGRLWAGLLILIIGFGLLARQLNIAHIFPTWLLSWPMILVVVGLIIGGNSNFKNPAGIILIGMGTLFLIQRHFDYNVWKLFFPVAIIVVGFYLLFVSKNSSKVTDTPWQESAPEPGQRPEKEYSTTSEFREAGAGYSTSENDFSSTEHQFSGAGFDTKNTVNETYISSTSIFSEEKMIVTSKNLQGGEIVNIFGGTDINLLHADIQGPIVIDLFQLFAGTKIIVPSHWKVHSKVVSIFGEVDDRRFFQENVQTEKKIIYLKGTSIFGGVTIKSI